MADSNRDTNPGELPKSGPSGLVRQLADVLDLPFILVGSVVIGAGAGYFLDRKFGISPVLTLALGGLGFVGGMVELIRRVTGKRGS